MNKKVNLLLAEDEPALGMIVKESLESRNFVVFLCENGQTALECYQNESIDIAVLDVMMPLLDGFSVAKTIRKENNSIPIIFLTAKSRTEDVIEGFSYGANDYMKKPFSIEELIVRVNALLSRYESTKQGKWIEIGLFRFHYNKQVLDFEGDIISLTNREAELLNQLYLRKNQVTERAVILNHIWGNDDFFNARSMDVFITKLRKKLKADESVKIVNIRGFGYKLICE